MAKITELSQLNLDGYYSYADYLKWQFKEAREVQTKFKLKAMFADDDFATPILFQELHVDLKDIFAD